MSEPRNAHCFQEPHWRLIASGVQIKSLYDDGEMISDGGILNPVPIDLPVGHRYYRFASHGRCTDQQVGGGWWLDYENFKAIENFASMHGYTLTEAARLFCALPIDWTRVDRLVSAILEVPLRAYAGTGQSARGNGNTTYIPMQVPRVIQLFIPGLVVGSYENGRDPDRLYLEAFPEPRYEYIAGHRNTAPPPARRAPL